MITAIAPEHGAQNAGGVNVTQGPEVERNLALVHTIVHCPSYRLQIKKAVVEAPTSSGGTAVVDESKSTKPCWKWDESHEIFGKINTNESLIDRVMQRYTVPDSCGGRLVSIFKAPEMLAELNKLETERMGLVDELVDKWDSEILPAIAEKFGEHFWQIRDRLPTTNSMRSRYRVDVIMRPLTVMTPDDLDLTNLSFDEREAVIASQQETLKQMVRERYDALFQTVFGEVLNLCADITEGPLDEKTGKRTGKSALETGKRKSGALTEIMTILERVTNFGDFATPQLLEAAEKAKKIIASCNIQDINQDGGKNLMTAAIKEAMKPLATEVTKAWEAQKGRVSRDIAI